MRSLFTNKHNIILTNYFHPLHTAPRQHGRQDSATYFVTDAQILGKTLRNVVFMRKSLPRDQRPKLKQSVNYIRLT